MNPTPRAPAAVQPPHIPPAAKKRRLGEILLDAGLITQLQLHAALSEQKKWGGKLGRVLVEMGFVDEESMVLALSRQLSLPRVNLETARLAPEIVQHLRLDIAERYGVFPLAFDPKQKLLTLATSDPTNQEAQGELAFYTGYKIQLAVCGTTAIDKAIRRYYYGEQTTASDTTTPEALGVNEVSLSADDLIQRSGVHSLPPSLATPVPAPLSPTAAAQIAQQELGLQVKELTDRLGALEKHAANQVRALRGLFELLVEKGFITRDEYLSKVRSRE